MWRKSLLLLLLELGSYCLSRLRARQSLTPSSDSNAATTPPKVEPPSQPASDFDSDVKSTSASNRRYAELVERINALQREENERKDRSLGN